MWGVHAMSYAPVSKIPAVAFPELTVLRRSALDR